MKKFSKITLLSVSLAILISSCSSNVPQLPVAPVSNIDQNEVSSFSSDSGRVMLLEQDKNKDEILTREEADISDLEMKQIDTNSDGEISKSEVGENLRTELANAIKITEALQQQDEAIYQDFTNDLLTPNLSRILPINLPPSTSQLNNVELFIDKQEILPMIFKEIQSAKKSIQMDLYLLGGKIGLQVAKELIKKFQEGVDIKITFDPNLGFSGPTRNEVYTVVEYLRKNKIEFKLFPLHLMPKETQGPLRNKFQIDHDKMIVIDESVFITGGFNLFDLGVDNRDMMLRIEGPTAKEASDLLYYEWTLSDKYIAPKPPKQVFVVKAAQEGNSMVKIVKTGFTERSTKPALISMINNAKQSVYLSVLEYSDMDLTKALINASKRGVDVRVIMDRKNQNDKYAGGLPVPNYFPNIMPAVELVKNHVPTRWYDIRMPDQELHMKMCVVDNQHLIAGSTNFTRQAFTTFRETSVQVDGGPAPEKMAKAFLDDWMSHSSAIKKITLKDKIRAKVVDFLDKRYYGWW